MERAHGSFTGGWRGRCGCIERGHRGCRCVWVGVAKGALGVQQEHHCAPNPLLSLVALFIVAVSRLCLLYHK